MRIALDAMGGDAAPLETVKGALLAVEAYPEVEVLLVGDEAVLRRELAGAEGLDRLDLLHAPETIGMNEPPVSALKRKPGSSIALAFAAVRAGRAEALVSAGNTGAVVAASSLSMKLLNGVKRPGIALGLPTLKGKTTVIDMGANITCKAVHLFQYAVMAVEYHRTIRDVPNPRVGLLSVGEEEAKGNQLVKETHALLAQSDLNFVGNVEGGDIFNGTADVVVCEGFVGNVALKVSEGLAEMFLAMLRDSARRDVWTGLGLKLLRPAFDDVARHMDFAEYGGAPLLGVDGICIICHGRSHAAAIKNAIGVAYQFAQQDVNGRILSALDATRPLWDRTVENNA